MKTRSLRSPAGVIGALLLQFLMFGSPAQAGPGGHTAAQRDAAARENLIKRQAEYIAQLERSLNETKARVCKR